MPTAPTETADTHRPTILQRVRSNIFYLIAVAWTATMLASLKWRFLDRFAAGTGHRMIGHDFFSIPRAFLNLSHGSNIYLTELSAFGPYATWYPYHPLLAVAAGSWLSIFSPWNAFWEFVVCSVALLFLGGRVLASIFADPLRRGFVYFCLFCSIPTYLMLWNAQAHVFLAVGICFILAGLMGLEQSPEGSKRHGRWVQIGLLLSLFTKPAVLLMLPVLMLTRETRRILPLPIGIYVGVSLIFLLVGPLNRGGYNGLHWMTIQTASASPIINYGAVIPILDDHTDNSEIYSLPMLLHRRFGDIPGAVVRTPAVLVVLMSALPLALTVARDRLRLCLSICVLAVCVHFLGYYIVWEYHYTSLLPCIPALLYLGQTEQSRPMRFLLLLGCAATLTLLIPTPVFLNELHPFAFMAAAGAMRVLPAIFCFVCTGTYIVAFWIQSRRREREQQKPSAAKTAKKGRSARGSAPDHSIAAELQRAAIPVLGMVTALSLLWLVVLETTPDRFSRSVTNWTTADWIAHLSDVSAGGYGDKQVLGNVLAMLSSEHYDAGQLDAAAADFSAAQADGVNPIDVWCDAAEQFQKNGFYREANHEFAMALAVDPASVRAQRGLKFTRFRLN